VLAALALVWSCGYEIRLFGVPVANGIHGCLAAWPPVRSVRALCRMGIIADLGFSVLAAYGFAAAQRAWVRARRPQAGARAVVTVIVCWLVWAEAVPKYGAGFPLSCPAPQPRTVDRWLARQPRAPLIELPLLVEAYESERLWHQLVHRMPIRNGARAFYPEGYFDDELLLGNPQSPEAIARLRALRIRYVLLDTDNRYVGRATLGWTMWPIAQMPPALLPPYVPLFRDVDVIAYELPPAPFAPPSPGRNSPVPPNHR
jgi:hypothetical protein